jgi:hypothetical protein
MIVAIACLAELASNLTCDRLVRGPDPATFTWAQTSAGR